MAVKYDRIGDGYDLTRRADPRITERLMSLLDAADARLMFESLVRLSARASARASARSPESGLAPESVRPALLAAVLAHVGKRLGDPGLCVAEVAAHFRISKRYVHKLFEPTGESFSGHVLRCRLERVAAELTDAGHARTSIAEIAYRNGFSDLSHFNRRFRARFEATPRDIRKKASR